MKKYSEGTGKVRYSGEVRSKNHIIFFLERQGARRCSHHWTSVGRSGLWWFISMAEHADSASSNWRHYTLGAYWIRSSRTAVLWCALFICAFIDLHCVRRSRKSLWGLKVKTESSLEKRLKILSQTSSLLLLLSEHCCYIKNICWDLLRLISCASPSLPEELWITEADNSRRCVICLSLCSFSTSAGHTVNLVASSKAWKLRRWLGLTFTYLNTAHWGCMQFLCNISLHTSGVLMCTVSAILLCSIILQQWLRTADYIFKHYYSEGRGDMVINTTRWFWVASEVSTFDICCCIRS